MKISPGSTSSTQDILLSAAGPLLQICRQYASQHDVLHDMQEPGISAYDHPMIVTCR